MKNARQVAFEVLSKIQKDNSYSNLALDNAFDNCELSQQDKNFASAIVYGVIERMITLDYQLRLYLSQPLKKLKPQVLVILRMGVYQLMFMDKVPESAAVNESVKLVKKNGASFASGLVNAVLHKIAKSEIKYPDKSEDSYLSVRYSAPEWLCNMWVKSYGFENAEKILNSALGETDITLKVNTVKTTGEKLQADLLVEGFQTEKNSLLENCITIKSGSAVHKTNSYKNGMFHVQDVASQFCCKALNACENENILDVCAAPGGKSFTIAEKMNNTGKVYSCDIYPHRLKLIENGAKRLGLTNIKTLQNDGSVYNNELPKFDKILCDVPCAGLGVIGKKPEIRYKNNAEFDKLPDLQYAILCTCAQYLVDGGTLIYSTCSLNPDENENVINRFLKEHSDFYSFKVLEELPRYGEDTDYITLMPHLHNSDGFFIAGIKKQ